MHRDAIFTISTLLSSCDPDNAVHSAVIQSGGIEILLESCRRQHAGVEHAVSGLHSLCSRSASPKQRLVREGALATLTAMCRTSRDCTLQESVRALLELLGEVLTPSSRKAVIDDGARSPSSPASSPRHRRNTSYSPLAAMATLPKSDRCRQNGSGSGAASLSRPPVFCTSETRCEAVDGELQSAMAGRRQRRSPLIRSE